METQTLLFFIVALKASADKKIASPGDAIF
jgi:hypothetical protein